MHDYMARDSRFRLVSYPNTWALIGFDIYFVSRHILVRESEPPAGAVALCTQGSWWRRRGSTFGMESCLRNLELNSLEFNVPTHLFKTHTLS